MSPWSAIKNHIYLLQLENYQLQRYGRTLRVRGWQRYETRQQVVWTAKLKAAVFIAAVLQLLAAVAVYVAVATAVELPLARLIIALAVYAAGGWVFGFWLSAAALALAPADYLIKARLVKQARQRLARHPALTVIGVTGSYGKTTMKEMLSAVLAEKYTVLTTAGNQNTPLGLSRLITKHLTDETEILIVEMGAYGPGDIAQLCAIARPHISVLTGVNEAHLERFGSLEVTIQTKCEIIRHAHPDALIVLNADDERVRAAAERQVHAGQRVLWYSAHNHVLSGCTITGSDFTETTLTQSAQVTCGALELGTVRTKLLADYIWGDVAAAALIGAHLQLTGAQIRQGIAALAPLEHRLQPIKGAGGILVIDDSYNGTPAGAQAAIRVLGRFTEKRKIYVTPGLVEMGARSEAVHEELGRTLAPVADLVILVENSASDSIRRGLEEAGFPAEHTIVCTSALAAHEQVKTIARAGDVILFQNDWTDNYA